jgi:hypothetical protein
MLRFLVLIKLSMKPAVRYLKILPETGTEKIEKLALKR